MLPIQNECQELLQQPKQVIQLYSQNEIIQYDTQENCNKIISDILEYNFEGFIQEVQQKHIFQTDDEQFEYYITSTTYLWSEDIFNKQNQNLSLNFVQNQDIIIKKLGKFNYFICKQFFSQGNMDLFVGYFENMKWCDYIFQINYSPNTSDISDKIEFIIKYGQIKEDQAVQDYHIQIHENIQILIMTKKTFLKLQSKSKKFQLLSFRYWNKKFFNDINNDKPFQPTELQKHNKICQKCLAENECNFIRNLSQFQKQQDKILDQLEQQGIFLCEYVNKGGEGLIFEGYRKNQQGHDDFVLKILFDMDEKQIQKEIKIMKLFEMNINVIQFIDFLKIEDNNFKIHVFILEKCKYSLEDELNIIRKKKIFTKSQLFQIVFDLLDGLIQLRIYRILHLDIKPGNILLSNQGNYVYTDFGISSIKKDGQKTKVKGGTPYYQSPEQGLFDPDIDFKSDIYSLGKTLLKVFETYEILSSDKSIQHLKNHINKHLIQLSKISRDDCLNIHESFLQTFIERFNEKKILDNYIHKIQSILQLSSFDKKKDIPYILNLKLYYSLKLLYLYRTNINHKNSGKLDTPFRINYSQFHQITSQKTNNLNVFQLYDLKKYAEFLNDVGQCYQNLGNNKKALEYYLESLQLRRQIFKENHPDIATSLDNVGLCYRNIGDNKKALEYQLESLKLRKQIFKKNHPNIATSMDNVGSCYQNLGDNKKALQYQLKSHQMRKQIFKENHSDIATSLDNVGYCYENLGDSKKSLAYQLESLKMRKEIFKENHPDIAKSLDNISRCHSYLGDFKKSFQYQLESLQMRKQIFKENHPDIARSLNNIGSCYEDLGDSKIQLVYYLESYQIFKQIYKENHPDIAKSLNNVGLCYRNLGDNKKALEYLLESLQMRKQIFKENHPDIATSLNSMGIYYHNLGDNKKALVYYLESLQMSKQIFKENHSEIATYLNNVGLCYQNLGDNKKALEYLLESLQMKKQIFKENHPDIATSLNNVGFCYENLGDNKKALEYQLESLQMTKQIFKENHPDIAASLNSMGIYYHNLGDNKKALEYLLESLQMRKQIFKENHPDIATSLHNVGCCYENLGDNKKALEYYLESLQMRKQIFKENHPDIATSLHNVGCCYVNLGDKKKGLEYLLESLQMRKQIFKENHPDIATSLHNVGCCYVNLGDKKKGLEYLLESLQMRKQIFKENHPLIAQSLNNIGCFYHNLGDKKKALEYYLESLQMRKQIFKENHPDIATYLHNVGCCYVNIGDKKRAQNIYWNLFK